MIRTDALRKYADKEHSEDLIFQVTDIADKDTRYKGETMPSYEILLTGITDKGYPVTVSVGEFNPFFYIRVPNSKTNLKKYMKYITNIKLGKFVGVIVGSSLEFPKELKTMKERGHLAGLSSVKIEDRKDLYWYKEGTEKYIRLEFTTKFSFYAWKKILLDNNGRPRKIAFQDKSLLHFDIYEANIEPTLRFIHATDIDACGWVKIESGRWVNNNTEDALTTKLSVTCGNYKNIKKMKEKSEEIASILIASFDIECDSSHGDFPLAVKRWEREVLLMTTTPELTISNTVIALREAVLGEEADHAISEPFGSIFMNKQPTREDTSKISDWITDELVFKVFEALKDKTNGKELAQMIMHKATPKWTGGLQGDPIIQIGTTFQRDGEIISRHIITLGSCDPKGVPDTEVISYTDEEDVIEEWVRLINTTDPDIITGYNITFFDMGYIHDRAKVLGIDASHINSSLLSRYDGINSRYRESVLSSAAMGDNFLKTIEMPGRVILDLCAAVRRNFASLSSYKLDSVAQEFLFGKIENAIMNIEIKDQVDIFTNSTFGLVSGGYLHVCDNDGEDIGGKFKIVDIHKTTDKEDMKHGKFVISISAGEESEQVVDYGTRWTQAKDDVPPSEIFRLQKGSAEDRAIVAKYCIQDCDLVLRLLKKLELVPNGMAMGSVCSVPLSYIFTRGQTVKSASLMFRECEKMGLIVPVMPSPTEAELRDSYEGAVVLEPKTGLYLEEPVAVLDYASLYPSSMISENFSHDSIVAIWDHNNSGNIVATKGNPTLAKSLDKKDYVDITFDRFEPDPKDTRKHPVKIKVGTRTCRYVQFPDGKKGIIGTILTQLLGKRKETKKRMKSEKDPFKKGLLNSLQLAYKVTANSLYGSLGAKNCKIRFQDIAASTTAYGRKLLNYAKEGLERTYGRKARSDCDAQYVYGDTDSVFVKFCPKYPDGKPMKGRDALCKTIELAKEAEEFLSSSLRSPHYLEYEKTFYPFMLFSKKRYIGMKYEEDPDHCKQANMGVVLKRRDNAPIVKEVYQAVVDTIMKERNLEKTIDVTKSMLKNLIDGKYSLKKLTITKSLRSQYANPESIAHKVLADRIGERDPGNKPKPNDRIPFIYFDSTKTRDSKKQGDRIETPEFMIANKLEPDYKHYITNQIQKPLTQLFALFWSQVPQSAPSLSKKNIELKIHRAKQNPFEDYDKIIRNIETSTNKDIERVVFASAIRSSKSKRVGPIDNFFKRPNKRK
jgi:DNA polymerase elongation subunit (family B)